jgi:hypothetical protein
MSTTKFIESIIKESTTEFKNEFASQDEDGNTVEIDDDYVKSFTTILQKALNKLSSHMESESPKAELNTLLKTLKETVAPSAPAGTTKKLLNGYQAYQQAHKGNYSAMVPWKDLSDEEKQPYVEIAKKKNEEEGRVSSKGTKKTTSLYQEFLKIVGQFNKHLTDDVKPKPNGAAIKKLGLYSKEKSLEELRDDLVGYYNSTYGLELE